VIWRREYFSLLFAPILPAASTILTSCAPGQPAKPDLPQSISPGWMLLSLNRAAAPPGIPTNSAPQCWKAHYAGQGSGHASAEVWVCGYKENAGAFDAVQRARAEAQTVKFQVGSNLVLVKWNDVPKANVTALVRSIQKAVQPSH
jgi:hypothetical protein